MVKRIRVSIIVKFLAIPFVATAGFAVFIIISLLANNENANRLRDVKEIYVPMLETANSNVVRIEQISEKLLASVTTGDALLIDEVKIIAGEFIRSLDTIAHKRKDDAEVISEVNVIKTSVKEYIDLANSVSKRMLDIELGKIDSDYEVITRDAEKMKVKLTEVKELLSDFQRKYKKRFHNAIKEADVEATKALDFGVGIGIFTVLVIFGVGISIALMITRNINNVVASFKSMARGDGVLTRVVECNSNDEVGDLVSSFNGFIGHLREIISVVEVQKKEIEVLNSSLEDKVQELHILATTDRLTGMKNFAYFQEELFKRVNEYKRSKGQLFLSLVIFDIDHFKQFNDTHGHVSGNIALKDVATRIIKHARKMDTPCRYGGEEFVVVLPKCNLEGARGFAERVRQEVERDPVDIESKEVGVTISVGCAEYKPDETIEEFIHRADEALYNAKESGRNRVEISP